MARRLVLLSFFYPPHYVAGGAARPWWFSKLLPEHGWDVWVFTGGGRARDDSFPQEAERVIRAPGPDLRTSALPGVSTGLKTLGRLFLWPDSRRFWLGQTRKLVALLRDIQAHALLACAPPYTDLLMAERASRASGVPFGVDLWDPWSDDLYDMYPTPFHRWLTLRAEARVFRNARFVSVINGAMKETLSRRYPGVRFAEVPFGYDPGEIEPTPLPRAPCLRILYLGSFFGKHKDPRGLSGLLDLPRSLPVEFSFIGDKSPAAEAFLQKLALGFSVESRGYLPHARAVQRARQAHALLILITRGPAHGLVSTGKVYEALAFGRAILGVVPRGTWIWRFLESHNAYLADPDEPPSLRAALEAMVDDWQTGELRTPDPDRVKGFTWARAAEKMASLLGG